MHTLNPKQELIEKLKEQFDIAPIRGSDIVGINSKAILYIRSSKNLGGTDEIPGRFWFGITKSEYDKYISKNFFIICVCAMSYDKIEYVVFPADKFEVLKRDMELKSGQWKFNILITTDNRVLFQISKKGEYDITEFVDNFDFSPKEFRREFYPRIGKFEARKSVERLAEVEKRPVSLEDELIATSRESDKPKNFEKALEKMFKFLGFECERIGGPGETDVLVTRPKTFKVDGKSTKSEAKTAINFTRIKRHMAQNNAEYMIIISIGFDPAVCRDAELEGATLISINTLLDIIKLHRENVLSPYDYIEVFKKPGIIDKNKMVSLHEKASYRKALIEKSVILLKNMDFSPRSLDEIKGRVDFYSEQKKTHVLRKNEIEKILAFLEHDILGIVNQKDNRYSLNYTPILAREKMKSIIKDLCLEPVS
jgi:hypothetical protein